MGVAISFERERKKNNQGGGLSCCFCYRAVCLIRELLRIDWLASKQASRLFLSMVLFQGGAPIDGQRAG